MEAQANGVTGFSDRVGTGCSGATRIGSSTGKVVKGWQKPESVQEAWKICAMVLGINSDKLDPRTGGKGQRPDENAVSYGAAAQLRG